MTNSSWPPRWLTHVPEEAILNGEGHLAVGFAERFGIITKDSVAGNVGDPINLREWQKQLLVRVFAYENGGLRHRVQLIGMPRKNGKSALGSVMALYSLVLGPDGGEVYSIAAEKEQAKIVFRDARRMVEAAPELNSHITLYRDAMENTENGSVYRVLSAEAYSKEGLSPTFVVFDELHAQPNRELFDVMSLAMGARGNRSTLVAITTAGVRADSTGGDSIAYSLYQYGQRVARGEEEDNTYFQAWWESEGEYRNEDTWETANPGFGDINDIDDFRSAIRRTPEAEFKTKRLNLFVSSQTSWLPDGAWEQCAGTVTPDLDDEIILGFDGSFSGDATAVVGAIIPKDDDDPIRVFNVATWEKDLNIHDQDWRVDIAEVEQTIIAFCQKYPKVREIACDPFRWQRSMEVLEQAGLPIVEWPSTSPRRMVPACAKFYDAVVEKRLIHDGDPVLSRHLDNAVTKIDNIGPRIVKDKKHSPRKIDAAVAAILAVDRATVGRMEDVVPQFFG
jgi:phage terminase large subunit-like protein